MAVAAITIATLFVAAKSSRNAVIEHTCSVDDTIWKFLPKKYGTGVTIYLNGTIISDFHIMLGDIL